MSLYDFKIEILNDSHWKDVYDLLRPFYDEGHWSEKGEFSPRNFTGYVVAMLNGSNVFGAYEHEKLVGIVSCEISYEFHVKPEAYVTNFYTAKEVRGKGLGRQLIESIIDFCKEQNCGNIYAANTGDFSERSNNLHDNLLLKYGFGFVSNNLRKVL